MQEGNRLDLDLFGVCLKLFSLLLLVGSTHPNIALGMYILNPKLRINYCTMTYVGADRFMLLKKGRLIKE